MATLKIGKCNSCGILVDFEKRIEKSGWDNHSTGERLARCPRCDEAIAESKDTLTVSIVEE
jgi:uncharacterized paraquat-inducible protein A